VLYARDSDCRVSNGPMKWRTSGAGNEVCGGLLSCGVVRLREMDA
jgi:hypothetical protein